MSGGDRLSYLLIGQIVDRIRGIKQCFARIATRVAAGTYAPRRHSAARRKPSARRPRPPNPLLQKFGWLIPLVPEAVVYRSQLECLLRDAEFAALLAAAPESMRRPIRSLCWMLRVDPPDILASPPPRPAPPPAAPATAQALPPQRSPSLPPARAASPPAPTPTPRACGPPLPA